MNTTTPAAPSAVDTVTNINVHANCFEDILLHRMMSTAHAQNRPLFRFFRSTDLSIHEDPQIVLDHFAGNREWYCLRSMEATLVILSEAFFAIIRATGNPKNCLVAITLWSDTAERADSAIANISRDIEHLRITDTGFGLHWRFSNARGHIESAYTEERISEPLINDAYPGLPDVDVFINDYLNAPEAILLLQGPPGTGKTRLIRGILAALSRRANEPAAVLYTGDMGVLDSDEVYLEFITGHHEAFVVEDADQLLKPRSDGNPTLHRFLNIADGIASAKGKKIIFSTNLSNIRDIDPALTRPGRCFAHLLLPELSPAEADQLLVTLCDLQPRRLAAARAHLPTHGKKTVSLAETYSAYRRSAIERSTPRRYGIQHRFHEPGLGLTSTVL